MATELEHIKAELMRGGIVETEELIKAMQRDYNMSETQVRIVLTRAGNTTTPAAIDTVRDIAEFTTLMDNDGAWWGAKLAEYQTITINNQGTHLTILFKMEPNPQSRLDPEVRLIANIKLAVQEYRNRFVSKAKWRNPITWLDIEKIPESICRQYGFSIIAAFPTKIKDAYENLLV